jgi:hypothetical protein
MGRSIGVQNKITLRGASNGNDNVFFDDASNNAIYTRSATLPDAGSAGYAVNCIINVTSGIHAGLHINRGTVTSASFSPLSAVNSTSAPWACTGFKDTATAGGDADEAVTIPCDGALDLALGQYSVSNDTDTVSELTVAADNSVTFTASADPSTAHTSTIGIFRQGGIPAFEIVFAGSITTGGGNASEAETIAGILATDRVLLTVTDEGTNTVTIRTAKCTANTLTAVFSADPGSDLVYDYVVFRQAGLAAPSHYIAAMGQYTAVTGDTTTVGPFTATGILATDKIILIHATSDDDDIIEAVVPGAGVITLTVGADPVTDHSYTWAAIRAY